MPSSATRTTQRCRCSAAWSPPAGWAGSRARASTTTDPPLPPTGSTAWRFPDASTADEHGVVAVGGDLEPGTLLHAYRSGLFPMHLDDRRTLAWWSPDPRGTIPLDGLRVSRSLRRSIRRYRVTVDLAFDHVIAACADPERAHGWINTDISRAYRQLHRLGWAHSIEAWAEDGELAGGLYGVAIGGLFAGESMFHRRPDASKVALCHLVDVLDAEGQGRLLDVQWVTPHLASLGAVAVPRSRYLADLERALALPLPAEFKR